MSFPESSEYFIHTDLAERAARIAEATREEWKTSQKVEPYAVTWPAAGVRGDDGTTIDQAVMCRIPTHYDGAQRRRLLQEMAARTDAYGLVVVLPEPGAVRVFFETAHGARTWVLPLERHGDVTACLAPVIHDDQEDDALHVLWRRAR